MVTDVNGLDSTPREIPTSCVLFPALPWHEPHALDEALMARPPLRERVALVHMQLVHCFCKFFAEVSWTEGDNDDEQMLPRPMPPGSHLPLFITWDCLVRGAGKLRT